MGRMIISSLSESYHKCIGSSRHILILQYQYFCFLIIIMYIAESSHFVSVRRSFLANYLEKQCDFSNFWVTEKAKKHYIIASRNYHKWNMASRHIINSRSGRMFPTGSVQRWSEYSILHVYMVHHIFSWQLLSPSLPLWSRLISRGEPLWKNGWRFCLECRVVVRGLPCIARSSGTHKSSRRSSSETIWPLWRILEGRIRLPAF